MSRVFNVKMGMGAKVRMDLDFKFDKFLGVLDRDALAEIRKQIEIGAARGVGFLADKVREFYTNGIPGHASLHPFTIQQKGHSTPLFDSGNLARSVRVVVRRQSSRTNFIVTVAPGLETIKASIAEEGAVLPVTAKMRRFLASRGFRLRKSTSFIAVPARPVFEKAIDATLPAIEKAIIDQMERGFGKIFGRF